MTYRDILFNNYTTTAYKAHTAISIDAYKIRERAFHQKFKKILPEGKNTPILDIGCGMGFFLWFLQNNGFTNSVGIDVSPEQIEVARSFGVKNINLCGWKEYLATKHSSFGFVILDNVIEHLTKNEITELLQAIFAALKPGGRLYISTPNSGSPFGVPLAFIDFTHEVFFTAASLSQVLVACGFLPVAISGEPLPAFDLRSFFRKSLFNSIKPFVKAVYIVGTGGGGRTSIPHIMEPTLAAIAEKPVEINARTNNSSHPHV
jgi:2-polyprenyl-3-methyl-5-hydroxy-6-metoxy-1,4-benzoquinol methylase